MSTHIIVDQQIGEQEIEIEFIDDWMDEMEPNSQPQIHVEKFDCRQCDYGTHALDEYLQHIRLQHIPSITCVCGVSCDGHEGLIAHMQSVHISSHSCPVCKEEIVGYCNLEMHINEIHLH